MTAVNVVIRTCDSGLRLCLQTSAGTVSEIIRFGNLFSFSLILDAAGIEKVIFTL